MVGGFLNLIPTHIATVASKGSLKGYRKGYSKGYLNPLLYFRKALPEGLR